MSDDNTSCCCPDGGSVVAPSLIAAVDRVLRADGNAGAMQRAVQLLREARQGTGHERVIPATDLRAWIAEWTTHCDRAIGAGVYQSGAKFILRDLSAWLDEYTTKARACEVCGAGPTGRCDPPDEYEGDCPHGCSPGQ